MEAQRDLLAATWCCGEDRPQSNFCAECGRQLRHGPLIDLLAHCQAILRRQRRNLDGAKIAAKRSRYEQAVATWEERCKALAAAIENQSSSGAASSSANVPPH